MYEVHAFFAEGEATKAMEPEYEAGERYVLIVFCRRPRYSLHDFKLVEEIARRFKNQTLISADEITFVEELEEGPAVFDERK